jgi:uncharacterized protein DUF397
MTAFEWIKSSYSGTSEHSNCVEVAARREVTAVRDSKAPGGHITLPNASWTEFLTKVRTY